MKVDMGFWNEKGEYIEDIQEVNEMEMVNRMDKCYKILKELNEMVDNFPNVGSESKPEERNDIEEYEEFLNMSVEECFERIKEQKYLKESKEDLEFAKEELEERLQTQIKYRKLDAYCARRYNKALQEIKVLVEQQKLCCKTLKGAEKMFETILEKANLAELDVETEVERVLECDEDEKGGNNV